MTELANNITAYAKQVISGLKQVKNLRLSQLRKVFSLMGKREKAAIVALAILAILNLYVSVRNIYYNHSVVVAAKGGQFTEGVLGQPTYINPVLAHQDPDLSLTKLVFSGLYKYDTNGALVPDLADGMPAISADQKQYTVNLKKGVKWHNDKPFSADDVLFTMQIIQDPAYKSPLRSMWQSTTVEKLSDYTVRFTTKDVSGPFIQNLTLPILPQAIWSRVEAQNFILSENNLKAVGTGPYAIKEIKKLASGKISQVTLEAFGDYYGGEPNIGTITVKFFDNETDLANALRSRDVEGIGFVSLGSNIRPEGQQTNLVVLNIPLPQYQVVFFNLNNKILSDVAVRKALSISADRRKIIHEVLGDEALLPTSPLLELSGLSNHPQNEQPDVAAANKLLDDAGWKVDAKTGLRAKKNQALELNMVTNDSLLNSKSAENLAAQWRQLHITVNVNVMATKNLTDTVIRPRNFDVLLFPEKFNADPDPFAFWHSSQVKDPGFNLTGYADPAADKLITEARTTTNQELRTQKYQQFDQLLASQYPVILLNQAVYTYELDSRVKNIGLKALYEPSQRFYDVPNWYIEQTRNWK